MSETVILAWLSPVIILILVVGVVAVVALWRAPEKHIEDIVKDCMHPFSEIGRTLPTARGQRGSSPGATLAEPAGERSAGESTPEGGEIQ